MLMFRSRKDCPPCALGWQRSRRCGRQLPQFKFKFKKYLSVASMQTLGTFRDLFASLPYGPTLPLKSLGDPLGRVFALSCWAWLIWIYILAYSKYLWVSLTRMCSSRTFHTLFISTCLFDFYLYINYSIKNLPCYPHHLCVLSCVHVC